MKSSQTFSIVVAGVGGQGAITMAQLILGAAWMQGLHVLQSEIHGMSQREGEVSAHILISESEVTSPTIEPGGADLLLGMEPLESLRHIHFLKPEGQAVTSITPVINMDHYPDPEKVLAILKKIPNCHLLDTDSISKELKFKQAGNIVLLGEASKLMPIKEDIWITAISERFKIKGEKVVEKNLEAFKLGRSKI